MCTMCTELVRKLNVVKMFFFFLNDVENIMGRNAAALTSPDVSRSLIKVIRERHKNYRAYKQNKLKSEIYLLCENTRQINLKEIILCIYCTNKQKL